MHHTCTVFPLLLFLLTFWTTQAQVEWIVENGGVAAYGQMLTLLCKVTNCCIQDSGWVQWNYDSIDFRTLIIDVTDFRNEKYSGKKRRDGFTLVISDLNETDLNRNYSCTYGADVGAMKLLLKEEAFNRTNSSDEAKEGLSTGAIVGISLAVVFVIVAAIIGWALLRPRNIYMQASTEEVKLPDILSLVVEPDHANVILGNNQTITCSISGQPSARGIIWYFTPTYESKVEISPENNAAKYSGGTISDPSLTIMNFQTSDNGAYVCTATNTAGTGNSNSSVLTCISNCQKLKDSFLSEIAKRLGHDWRQVQIVLEITTKELEQIERKYINEPVTQTTEALIMWRNRKSNSTEEDNVRELINALTFAERQDIIDDLRLEM